MTTFPIWFIKTESEALDQFNYLGEMNVYGDFD